MRLRAGCYESDRGAWKTAGSYARRKAHVLVVHRTLPISAAVTRLSVGALACEGGSASNMRRGFLLLEAATPGGTRGQPFELVHAKE
jgi:hypothetical protein